MRLGRLLKLAAVALPLAFGGTAANATDVVDIALASDQHQTLVTALQAADLVDTLRGRGPFTVFAPTDEAFAALPAGTLEELLKPENKGKLTEVLTFHVVSGVTMMHDVKGKAFFAETVQGQSVFLQGTSNGKIFVSATPQNDVSKKSHVVAQIRTGNGVVMVVDKVLLPPQ